MKRIFIFLALIYQCGLSAQVVSWGPGTFVWTRNAPAHNPGNSGAKFAVDTVTFQWYEWLSGTSWQASGQRLQEISGTTSPAYTPGKHDSYLVINFADSLYRYRAGAWRHINQGGSGGGTALPASEIGFGNAGGTAIVSDTAFKFNATNRTVTLSKEANTNRPAYQINYKDATAQALNWLRLHPVGQSNNAAVGDFNFWAANIAPQAGRSRGNHVWSFGYNLGAGSTREILTDGALLFAFESNFYNASLAGGIKRQSEIQFEWQDTLGVNHRFITGGFDHDGRTGAIELQSDGFKISRFNPINTYWVEANRFQKYWAFRDSITVQFDKNNFTPLQQNRGPVYAGTSFPLIGYNALGVLQLGNVGDPTPTKIGSSFYFDQVGGVDVIGTDLGDGATNFAFGTAGKRWNQVTINAAFELPLKLVSTGNSAGWGFGLPSSKNLYLYNYDGSKTPVTIGSTAPDNSIVATSTGIGIQNNSPSRTLDIGGEARVRDLTTTTPTVLVAADGDGVLSASTIGTGLSLSSGVLSATTTATIGGSGAAGQIAHFTGATAVGGTNNHFWDTSNGRLGIYTTTPSVKLDVHASSVTPNWIGFTPTGPAMFVTATENSTSSGSVLSSPEPALILARSGIPGAVYSSLARFNLSKYATAGGGFAQLDIALNFGDDTPVTVLTMRGDGNVGVGTAAPAEKLDVTGNVRFSGAIMPNNAAGTTGQVLKSAGAGAPPTWASIASSNSGTKTATGTATTTFTVTIPTQPNNTYTAFITPLNALSAALYYVTNKTTTTFDVVYLAGLTGSVAFDWQVLQP